MLMVIFGAGASYDSAPTYPPGVNVPNASGLDRFYRPPVANELFQDRPMYAGIIERFRECSPIVPRLRRLHGETLEAALQDLQAQTEHYPRGLQQLAAVRYYLQMIIGDGCASWRSVIRGVTNYGTLLDLIERRHGTDEPVVLVTFNYDTLLEEALTDFDLVIEDIRSYTQGHPFYRVFKLHGSVNWAKALNNKIEGQTRTDPNVVAHEWIRRAAELEFIPDMYLLNPYNGYPTAVVGDQGAFPAIAIPVERGKIFECPIGQIEELKALLPQVSKMLIIGWRAGEQHFLDLLKQYLSAKIHLYVVAGAAGEAEDVRSIIVQSHSRNLWSNAEVSGLGFTDFILSGKASAFL